MKKNGFAGLIIILIIAILGVVGYFGYKSYQNKISQTIDITSQTPFPTTTYPSLLVGCEIKTECVDGIDSITGKKTGGCYKVRICDGQTREILE